MQWRQVALAVTIGGGAIYFGYYVLFRKKKAKCYAGVVVACTGFGKFKGVTNNPTEIIVKKLPSYLRANPIEDSRICIDRCKIIEVSGDQARSILSELKESCFEPTDYLRVWLHLGVDSNSTVFKLETTAWNEADFRCPDESGWQPSHEAIVKESDIRSCLKSKLPLSRLCSKLRKIGYPVSLSSDAGRFVCNYTYYLSLRNCTTENDSSLFVHCPPFEVIHEEKQLGFIRELMNVLASEVCD